MSALDAFRFEYRWQRRTHGRIASAIAALRHAFDPIPF